MLRRLLRHRLSLFGGTIILIVMAMALASPLLAKADPLKITVRERMKPPSAQYWFGTDQFGRDLYSRVVYGARYSLGIAGAACALALVSGGILGMVSGYVGGRLDMWLMRATDVLLAFPSLLLAIGLAAAMGQGAKSIILALWAIYLPRCARLWRAAVLEVRVLDYVQAAQAAGASTRGIMWRHIVPNILSPVVVQASAYFSEMILAEAALSFLGLGTPPPAPTWGNILGEGRQYMRLAPWISVFPGMVIALTVLGLNLLGDALRDVADPRTR